MLRASSYRHPGRAEIMETGQGQGLPRAERGERGAGGARKAFRRKNCSVRRHRTGYVSLCICLNKPTERVALRVTPTSTVDSGWQLCVSVGSRS